MKNEETLFAEWIGKEIIKLRKSNNITQEEMAKTVDVSRATYINYEKGRQCPSVFVLWKVAQKLNEELSYFLPQKSEHLNIEDSKIIRKNIESYKGEYSDKALSTVAKALSNSGVEISLDKEE